MNTALTPTILHPGNKRRGNAINAHPLETCSCIGVSSSALLLQTHKTEVARCARPEVISTRDKISLFIPSILILLQGNTWHVNLSAALFPDYNNQYPHHTKYHISALITKLQRSTVRENCWRHLTLEIAFLFIIFERDLVV